MRRAGDEARQQLVQAALQGESDRAMHLTCTSIHAGHIDALEDAWVELAARIGARPIMPYAHTWLHTCTCIAKLLHGDTMSVPDALQVTAMLVLLFHRPSAAAVGDVQPHMQALRKEIVENFPEGGMLSLRGQQCFGRLLPPHGTEVHVFAQRILSGFGRLFEQSDPHAMHRSLEYVARKKVQIPLQHVWPAPTPEQADKGDPCWFLWGMLLLYATGAEASAVQTMYELYVHRWRCAVKTARMGLLTGAAHVLCGHRRHMDGGWSDTETRVLQNVHTMGPRLWESVRKPQNNNSDAGKEERPRPDGMSLISTFFPRVVKNRP